MFCENKSFFNSETNDSVHWLSAKGVQISPKLRDSSDDRLSVRLLQESFLYILRLLRPEPGRVRSGSVQTCPHEKTLQSLSLSSWAFHPAVPAAATGDERFSLFISSWNFTQTQKSALKRSLNYVKQYTSQQQHQPGTVGGSVAALIFPPVWSTNSKHILIKKLIFASRKLQHISRLQGFGH